MSTSTRSGRKLAARWTPPAPVASETIRASTGKAPNTMRISLGLASNFADVFAFLMFARRFVDVPGDQLPAE